MYSKKWALLITMVTFHFPTTILQASSTGSFSTLEEEYTPSYCFQLEAAYGSGMMSEGGSQGIDLMFDGISLDGKKALDIGSGLGGVAFYLAEKYGMRITGLEVNPWMVEESKRRVCESSIRDVDFVLSTANHGWPFQEKSFDLIYSKGVLTHLEHKDQLFQECHHLLKEEGVFVITDWLSSEEKKWGSHIGRLVELEHLVLFPESESGYVELLKRNGFTILSVRDDSGVYEKYNMEIIEHLKSYQQLEIPYQQNFKSQEELEASIEGYEAILKALKQGELRVLRFVAQKSQSSDTEML